MAIFMCFYQITIKVFDDSKSVPQNLLLFVANIIEVSVIKVTPDLNEI